jgi:hypothetical protein
LTDCKGNQRSKGAQTSDELRILEQSSLSRGRYTYDEDKIGLVDGLVDLGGEEEVLAPARLDDIDESGLVDGEGEVLRVPGVDSGLVQVDDGDLAVGLSQDRRGREDGGRGGKGKEERGGWRGRDERKEGKEALVSCEFGCRRRREEGDIHVRALGSDDGAGGSSYMRAVAKGRKEEGVRIQARLSWRGTKADANEPTYPAPTT